MFNPLVSMAAWFERTVWRPLADSVIEHWLFGDEPPVDVEDDDDHPLPDALHVQNAQLAIRDRWPEDAVLEVFGRDVLKVARQERASQG